MKKAVRKFKNMGIKKKLLLTYILLITIPMCIIGFKYYITTKAFVSDIVKKNLHETIIKNNKIIDSKLKQVKEYSLGFVVDKNLADLLSKSYDLNNQYELYQLDNKITDILNKYFLASQDIYSVRLASSEYVFGNGLLRDSIPTGVFKHTELNAKAVAAGGKLTWVPTYKFAEMYNQPKMENLIFDYKYMFSAVKLMNATKIKYKTGDGLKLDDLVLIISFTDKFYDQIFDNDIPIKNMYYFIISEDGRMVTSQDNLKMGEKVYYPWLNKIYEKGSGEDVVEIDGKKTIIIYDTSNITGWVSIFAMQEDFLIQDIMPAIKYNLFSALIIFTMIPLLISLIFSNMIARPIASLIQAINQMGRGNLDIRIPEEGSYEFKTLIRKFNSMNRRIQRLIRENYKMVLMKKEVEIKALSLQLNPHFMYNTLNIINLKLMENGQDETSELIVSLSTMLKLSLKTNSDLIPFHKDMDYTKSYIHIMSKRFEGKFEVQYAIDPRLFGHSVPKFFLQPLVENVLVHGFNDMTRRGLLKITCWIEQDKRYFSVEDNGIGMSREKLGEIVSARHSSIGINNIRNRIQMIYGEKYGLTIHSEPFQGTQIVICLPM